MTFEEKARRLRKGYRYYGERGFAKVKAEYERLFPQQEIRLDQILASAWTEARELAGWAYDLGSQHWVRKDGSVVIDDDGRELVGV
jgi:hypothetical protein